MVQLLIHLFVLAVCGVFLAKWSRIMPKARVYFPPFLLKRCWGGNSIVYSLHTKQHSTKTSHCCGRAESVKLRLTKAFRSLIPIEINRSWVLKGTCECGSDYRLGCITMLLGGTTDGMRSTSTFRVHFHSHVGPSHCLNTASPPSDHHRRWVCRQLVLCDSPVEPSIDSSPQQRFLSFCVSFFLMLVPASATNVWVHDICCFSLFNLKR